MSRSRETQEKTIIATPSWHQETDATNHTVFEHIIIFANLICLSLESFSMSTFAQELKSELDKGQTPEFLSEKYGIPVENIKKIFTK